MGYTNPRTLLYFTFFVCCTTDPQQIEAMNFGFRLVHGQVHNNPQVHNIQHVLQQAVQRSTLTDPRGSKEGGYDLEGFVPGRGGGNLS